MASNEKEINNMLFDQLDIVERFEAALNESVEKARQEIETQKRQINRKLYQKPPLTTEN
ncbi:MAG: hypothetical protein IJ679_11230 [Lachnospiraceae bacterium]|nr:hypothetical protein [Lachnospiraceae bacterium]